MLIVLSLIFFALQKVLHPEELMSFVIGSGTFDFEVLKEHTEYLNGYGRDHHCVVQFWRVVLDFPVDAKKKLLGRQFISVFKE